MHSCKYARDIIGLAVWCCQGPAYKLAVGLTEAEGWVLISLSTRKFLQ